MKSHNVNNIRQQMKVIVPRMLGWLRKTDIYWLVFLPLVSSLILLSGLLFIGNEVYKGEISEVYYSVSGAICLIIASLSGVVQVIKREGVGIFGQPIYGLWPRILGGILVFIFWVIALALLVYAIHMKRP